LIEHDFLGTLSLLKQTSAEDLNRKRRTYIRSSSLSIILLWGYASKNGIPLPETPPALCRVFVPAVARVRMLRMFPGAVLNTAPFITELLGVVR
jgi:hypothetical protein